MDPFKKFKSWFALAKKNHPYDHTAFALSTVSRSKVPNVRMVLLKMILSDGFVFFTNLNSTKGKDFKKNHNLSMCFYWESIKKQIRINGKGIVVDDEISDRYYNSRSRGSRIGAWVSKQSSVIKNYSVLKEKENYFNEKFKNKIIPRPDYWVGIKILPSKFEFWEEKEFRLHKRELFYLKKKVWEKKNLSP